MKIKKVFLASLSLLACISLASCSLTQEDSEITVVEKNISFKNYSNEYDIKADSIKTYFIDDSTIPYVDCQEFVKNLSGLFDESLLSYSRSSLFNECKINYKLGGLYNVTSTFNWKNNTIRLSDVYALGITKETAETDFSEFLQAGASKVSGGSSVTLKLGDFGFDIYNKDNKCLVPFSIMHFLYCSYNYYNIYYNGEGYYGDYLVIKSSDQEKYNEVYTTAAKNRTITLAEREENYNFLKFVMTYFYGLRGYYDDLFDKLEELKPRFLSTDPEVFTAAEYEFLYSYLNEMHTGVINQNYYISNFDKTKYFGSAVTNYKEVNTLLMNKRKELGIDYDEPTLRFKDNTAIIYFTDFEVGEKDKTRDSEGNVKEDAYKYDSYFMMRKFMDEISKRSEIKNVVFDLTNNGGGALAALMKIMGFITNSEIKFAEYNPLNNRSLIGGYYVDVLGNGEYGANAYKDYNYFVETSLLTYSSANIMSGICKNMGTAKIIGQKSGGGMCGIIPIVAPDGLTYQISGNLQLRIPTSDEPVESKLLDIEHGIDVNYEIPYSDFYDDDKLVTLLNSIN